MPTTSWPAGRRHLCRRRWSPGGGAFSIENLLSSLTLQLKALKARAKLPGVKTDASCQCTTPTPFLNNLESTPFLNNLEWSEGVVAARRWACACPCGWQGLQLLPGCEVLRGTCFSFARSGAATLASSSAAASSAKYFEVLASPSRGLGRRLLRPHRWRRLCLRRADQWHPRHHPQARHSKRARVGRWWTSRQTQCSSGGGEVRPRGSERESDSAAAIGGLWYPNRAVVGSPPPSGLLGGNDAGAPIRGFSFQEGTDRGGRQPRIDGGTEGQRSHTQRSQGRDLQGCVWVPDGEWRVYDPGRGRVPTIGGDIGSQPSRLGPRQDLGDTGLVRNEPPQLRTTRARR